MSVFSVKTGERVSITSKFVDIEFPDLRAKGVLKLNATFWATATNQFKDSAEGVRRRLFVDMSEDFGCGREIWLTDGPSVIHYTHTEDEWPDEIG